MRIGFGAPHWADQIYEPESGQPVSMAIILQIE